MGETSYGMLVGYRSDDVSCRIAAYPTRLDHPRDGCVKATAAREQCDMSAPNATNVRGKSLRAPFEAFEVGRVHRAPL